MARRDQDDLEEEVGPSFLREYGEEAYNPLVILGEDILEELTDAQQTFLLARMVVARDVTAAKRAGVQADTVRKWKQEKDSAFMKAYHIIRSDPVNFALTIAKNIVAKAAVEHMSLLNHPNVRVRQWAIDLAYRNQGLGQDKGQTNNNYIIGGSLFETLKELAKVTPVEEDEPRALNTPVEADYRVLGTAPEAERVAEVRPGPEVLSQ